ncbi:hypothetical protein LTR08_002716 [Meristemomyces frigidus]|nr:hypothetical protein LTR08_002716 [Meristemomyces frigidus]
MPGYRRPATTAFAPNDPHHFDALEQAFQGTQWASMGVGKSREHEVCRYAVPTTYADISTSGESSVGSRTPELGQGEGSRAQQVITPVKERLAGPSLRRTSGKVITPPHLTRLTSGLPPTPPTMANSEDAEPRAEGLASNLSFADAVRNALHAQKSGLSAPGRQLPSPDLTPPGTSENLVSPVPQSGFLQPLRAPQLRQYPSSRADSYHTAREAATPGASQLQLPLYTQELQSSNSWLGSVHEDQPDSTTVSSPNVEYTPILSHRPSHLSHISEMSGLSAQTPTPAPLHPRKQRPYSPYRPFPSDDTDFEKHISYISDQAFEEQARSHLSYQSMRSNSGSDKHMSYISDHTLEEEANVEDVNNLVYQQILEENVKRHSALSNENAVPVGIWFPEQTTKEHRLRRTTKAASLRNVSGKSNVNSQWGNMDGSAQKQLRHRDAMIPSRSLEASPIVERSPFARRQVPRPGDHGQASEMNAFTQGAVDKATMERLNFDTLALLESQPFLHYTGNASGQQHTLRHAHRPGQATLSTLRHSSAPMAPLRHFRMHAESEASGLVSGGSGEDRSIRQQSPPRIVQHALRHVPPTTKAGSSTSIQRTSQEVNGGSIPRTSLETPAGTVSFAPASPPAKSLEARFLRPTTTLMSTSQLSAWSEAELCEAEGVNIYPHNNHSLLLVQHGSSPTSRQFRPSTPPRANYLGLSNNELGIGQPLFGGYPWEPSPRLDQVSRPGQPVFGGCPWEPSPRPDQASRPGQPVFAASLQEPSPRLDQGNPTFHIDSPLTNPRAAPMPPVFQVIPPTPNEELDRQLDAPDDDPTRQDPTSQPLQRRLSLAQRARRFSESFIEQPLFGRSLSSRKQLQRADDDIEVRPTHLSPLWRPSYLWDGYESDENDFDDGFELEGVPASTCLPQGGDTSEVEERERKERKRGGFLPRNMSVRMPGFRGQGGFLVGNSLGLDRHGTNNRRHHVVVKKGSMGGFGCSSRSRVGYVGELRARSSEEMLRRQGGVRLPWAGGRRLQFVGISRARRRVGLWREERVREKRREELRGCLQRAC